MVICANCSALRERVQALEIELGVRRRESAVMLLMRGLNLEPQLALIALQMYEAKGGCASHQSLLMTSGASNEDCLKTQICRLRQRLGSRTDILTYPRRGYGLSLSGMSRVAQVLA